MDDELARARKFLDLEDDWDGMGSKGYKEATWLRVKDFIMIYEYRCIFHDKTIVVPRIHKSSNGGFDLVWRARNVSMLANIPEGEISITAYGEKKGKPVKFLVEDKNLSDAKIALMTELAILGWLVENL